ncbi:MAG: hypothetical protein NDP22_02190 [Crenarchaeota archaeon]|nr:hypothetical protein [Thermoproteota archaeon]
MTGNEAKFETLEYLTTRIHGLGKITAEIFDEIKALGLTNLVSYCESANLRLEEILSLLGYYSPPIGFLVLQLNAPRILVGLDSDDTVVGFLEPTYIATHLGTKIRLRKEYTMLGTKLITHYELINRIVASAKIGREVALVCIDKKDLTVPYDIRLRGLATSISYVSIDSYNVQEFNTIKLEDYKTILMEYLLMIDSLMSGLRNRLAGFLRDITDEKVNPDLETIIDAFGIYILNEESFVRFYMDAYIELKAVSAVLRETIKHIRKQLAGKA